MRASLLFVVPTRPHSCRHLFPGCIFLRARANERAKKRRKAGVRGGFLSLLRAELSEGERERWMERRALVRSDRFTVGQRRELREW